MVFNYYIMTFLLITLPYSIISIKSDIKTRKVPNIVNLSFFIISFLVFFFFIKDYDFLYYLCLLVSIGIGYFLYYKSYWGGADGKIFIALTMLILALGNYVFYLNWIVNLLLIYSISIIFIVLFKTKTKDKIKALKEMDYNIYVFQMLLVFIFLKNILNTFVFKSKLLSMFFLLVVVLCFGYLNPLIKKYYTNFSFKKKTSLNIILFIIFIGMSVFTHTIIFYFFGILIFRILVDYISNMTLFLKDKKDEKYYSPFTIYLFTSAILTMIVNNNIVEIAINIFKFVFNLFI